MIKFEHIILEAGLNPKDFQGISEIPVELFDRKNREIKDEKFFDFGKKLFAKNPESQNKFREFLETLNQTKCPKISGHLDDDVLILRPQGFTSEFFWL